MYINEFTRIFKLISLHKLIFKLLVSLILFKIYGMVKYSFKYNQISNPEEIVSSLKNNGFVVIRDIIKKEYIFQSREVARNHLKKNGIYISLGKSQPNASVEIKELSNIFSNANILRLFNLIFDKKKYCYTNHADVHLNILSGWHKDSGEDYGGYFDGDYFNDTECEVYKVAIYLQDTRFTNDGLTVKAGSHKGIKDNYKNNIIKLNTMVGDIVIFDVRLSHKGRSEDTIEKVIRIFDKYYRLFFIKKNIYKYKTVFNYIGNMYFKLKQRSNRYSIFFTFGKDNDHTKNFSKNNMSRQEMQLGYKNNILPFELKRNFIKNGVKIFE